jgi:predicted PurR-regulated permease PerM
MDQVPQKIEITYKTILFVFGVVLALWVLYEIRDIAFLLFLAVIASSGLRPSVDRLVELKLPRIAAILMTFIVVFSFGFLMLAYLIPNLVRQSGGLISQLGYFFQFLSPYIQITPETITDKLAPFSANIYRATISVFSGLINMFSFVVFTFYLLLERRHLRVFLKRMLGEELKEKTVMTALRIEERLGSWVQGELSLMIIIGLLTFIGLKILGIPSALPLAIIAGLLEIVPIIGPILSAIPAVIVALIQSPMLAGIVIILYIIIQQVENHFIVPFVMKKAVGVPPMVSILAILIGGKLAGTAGALLAIPFFICIQILADEFLFKNKANGSS